MDSINLIAALSALAQATRLDVFRMLVAAEPDGMPAGEIARILEVPHNTLSAHLAILTNAGLLTSERRSRSIVYRADLSRLREMLLYLLKDCCAGRPEICSPLIADLIPCETPGAMLNREGVGAFKACGTGCRPEGEAAHDTLDDASRTSADAGV